MLPVEVAEFAGEPDGSISIRKLSALPESPADAKGALGEEPTTRTNSTAAPRKVSAQVSVFIEGRKRWWLIVASAEVNGQVLHRSNLVDCGEQEP
jgi:hypothetical protein